MQLLIMDVLGEILDWSGNRPIWQRDALRRLVLEGEFSEEEDKTDAVFAHLLMDARYKTKTIGIHG